MISILSARSFLISDVAIDEKYTKPEQPWFISKANEFFEMPSLFCSKQALVGRGLVGD